MYIRIYILFVFFALPFAEAEEVNQVRVAVLNFGTVNWELDVIKHHGLDKQNNIDLQIIPLGSKNASAVALQAKSADIIVTDWIWVARQRAEGRSFTFAPYSLAVGGVMVRPDAGIKTLKDLYGKPLGIAGGPVDKSWVLLRAYSKRVFDVDISQHIEPKFGTPPLMAKLMSNGDLPAAINFWHYNARLKAQGMTSLITIKDLLTELDINKPIPLLGWVFDEDWARQNRATIQGFLKSSYQAKRILLESDSEWERLQSKTKAEDMETLISLRDSYRQGVPLQYNQTHIDAAQAVFKILADEGGKKLIGNAKSLVEEVFWSEFNLASLNDR